MSIPHPAERPTLIVLGVDALSSGKDPNRHRVVEPWVLTYLFYTMLDPKK